MLNRTVALACVVLLGCGSEEPASFVDRPAGTSLDTFVGDRCLEVDKLSGAGDANLFTGSDPADGTASAQLPVCAAGAYIDWDDLAADAGDHVLSDLGTPDSSAFPGSNECVGTANVLDKQDLLKVSAASNDEFVYLGVLRSANTGDSSYLWLFTKEAPSQILGQAPCKSSERRLLYDISPDDVLIRGHFKPSSGPLIEVFLAREAREDVPATAASDASDASLWALTPAAATVAVNTTPTAPGLLTIDGVKTTAAGNLGAELFAEAAIPLSVFTGGPACGATLFGSVLTHPSGSQTSDLKDLAGPALFNFGPVTATATLSSSCDGALGFAAQTADGLPAACAWVFTDASGAAVGTSGQCVGTIVLPPGSYTGEVAVTTSEGCEAAASAARAEVAVPLTVSLQLAAAAEECPGMATDAATYRAVVSGGAPPYSFAWAGAVCAGDTCTIDPEDGDFCASAQVSVSVDDTSPLCPPAVSETETYSKVTAVSASDQ